MSDLEIGDSFLDFGMFQFDGNDQKALRELLCKIDPIENPIIGELGVWTGRTTSILAGYCKNRGCGKVNSIDHFSGSPGTHLENLASGNDIKSIFLENIKKIDCEKYVDVCDKNSLMASKCFPDNYFDFFFIDADHTYNFIKQDIDLWWPKLSPGGIMCGHDFEDFKYDEKYIHQDYVEGRHHGVIKAVTESFDVVNKISTLWWVKK